MNLRIYFYLFAILLVQPLFGQNLEIEPEISPEFFTADQEITITYNVTGTIMQNWQEAWLWTWLPGASGYETPSNVNPANSNASLSDLAKFTKIEDSGNFYFSLSMTPENFFTGVTGDITDIGFIIKGNDWSDGQSIDFVTEVGDGLRIIVESPLGTFGFYDQDDIISVVARTSRIADIEILIDDVSVASVSNALDLTTDHTVISDGQVHIIEITANADTETTSTTYNYLVPPNVVQAPVPAGARNGINYDQSNAKATLVLEAPNKENVFVIGDFNNWQIDNDYFMNQEGERFWIELDNLDPNELYRFQYLVDGDIRIADPYSERISSPFDDEEIISDGRYPGLEPYPSGKTTEGVGFLQIIESDPYQWSAQNYTRPEKEDLVIYELLVRDFTDERTFTAVIEKLDYLKNLGINAIELMPVMEFEGNLSWGYNPAFMFSVDKYYGTENQLKKLIDEAHKKGIAVILDIVLNHAFGRCPLVRLDNDDLYGPPTVDNVWLNRTAKHDFNVGYDFNHESSYTKAYVDRVNEFWIDEYQIDGFRFDLSKGFTQKNTLGNTGAWGSYDQSRIDLLKRMADHIWTVDPDSYVMLEHFADNSEEKVLADYGMMIWGNFNHRYRSAARGNPSILSGLFHEEADWEFPHKIGYMESHDEERVMWEVIKNNEQSVQQGLERIKANAVFFFLVPGPKMIWQFEELGYDEELNNDRLGIKPTHWEYLDDPERKKLHDVFSSLIHLKTETDYIQSDNFSWSGNGFLKWINIDNPDTKIAAFGNFSKFEVTMPVNWPSTGTWYNYFSGESIEVEQATDVDMTLQASEVHVYTSTPIDNYIGYNPLKNFTFGDVPTELALSPNPSDNEVNISFPPGVVEILVFDSLGRLVDSMKMDPEASQTTLDVSKYPSGVYAIAHRSGKDILSKLFYKHR